GPRRHVSASNRHQPSSRLFPYTTLFRSRVEEPYIKATIITKSDFVGNVMSLCIEKRGHIVNQTYLTTDRVELIFDMPLAEISSTDRKSTRLNSSHVKSSYAVFCLKKKTP